jgi:aminotransferase
MRVSAIKEVELLAAKRGGVVSLAQGIPAFDTPEPLKQAAVEALASGKAAAYSLTYGLPELRQAIQKDLAGMGMEYDWETEIVVTCGATEAITASLRALVSKERPEVVVPVPSYASYVHYVQAAGGVVKFLELDEERGWALDMDELRRLMGKQTAAILIANPNNPTGQCYSREELNEVAALARQHGSYLLTDEVYRNMVFEGEEPFSPAQNPENRDCVVRVMSFSKAYAMTGWRVGYLHSDVSIVNRIVGVHDAFVTCAPVVSQYAAIAALTKGRPYLKQFRDTLRRHRDELSKWMERHPELFEFEKPPSAYFLFPKLKTTSDDWAFTHALLLEAGVAVVPGSAFGPNGAGHVRFCFGRSEADLKLACARMDQWIRTQRLVAGAVKRTELMAAYSGGQIDWY